MVTKFHYNMETEFSLACSKQPAIEQIVSVPIFTYSLWYITFNSIRYLRPCLVLKFLCISHAKHCMIHDLHISYDFISPPVFVPLQLQHNNLFHAFTTLPADRSYGYSQRMAISCDVSETLSTMKSAVLTTITCSQTERNQFLPLPFTFCFLTAVYFVPTH
jgi:hypothetical protein